MKRWLIASILFLLPSCIAFPLVRIFGGEGYSFGRKSRIGFSLILTSGIYLGEGAVIQSGNLILTKSIHLGTRSRIQRMNLLKGRFRVQLDAEAVINKYNRILSASSNLRESELILGNKCHNRRIAFYRHDGQCPSRCKLHFSWHRKSALDSWVLS